MSSGSRRSASDFTTHGESPDTNPTISELLSALRDSFQDSDFDRVEAALLAREAHLIQRHKEARELDLLERLKLAEDLNALEARPPEKKKKKTEEEDKVVISQLLKKNDRLERENSRFGEELGALESRIGVLEDEITKWINQMILDSGSVSDPGPGLSEREKDHRNTNCTVVNLENVFDWLIAAQVNGNMQSSGKEEKLERVIQRQKEEFATLTKVYQFESQKLQKVENEYAALKRKHQHQLEEKVKVENEIKDCQEQFVGLKEELKVMEEKHRNEYQDIERKHKTNMLEMIKLKEDHKLLQEKLKNDFKAVNQKRKFDHLEKLKFENELQVFKADFDKLKDEQKVLEEKHKSEYNALEQKYQSQLLEVENELKHCKAELQKSKEEQNVSNEKYEKLLEERNMHRRDMDEMVNFNLQRKKEEAESMPDYLKSENTISQLDKRCKSTGMADGSRKQKCIVRPNLIINLEDCDSVPASTSPQGDGVGNSGTLKFSCPDIILIDSDDDCSPMEPKHFGLKRKRVSSPNASDNHNSVKQQNFPTSENKPLGMLGRCDSLVGDYAKQNNTRSHDKEILRPSEEKVSEIQKSSIESLAMVNHNADSSSTSAFSTDDSEDDDDLSLPDYER